MRVTTAEGRQWSPARKVALRDVRLVVLMSAAAEPLIALAVMLARSRGAQRWRRKSTHPDHQHQCGCEAPPHLWRTLSGFPASGQAYGFTEEPKSCKKSRGKADGLMCSDGIIQRGGQGGSAPCSEPWPIRLPLRFRHLPSPTQSSSRGCGGCRRARQIPLVTTQASPGSVARHGQSFCG